MEFECNAVVTFALDMASNAKRTKKEMYWQYLLCWHALLLSIILLYTQYSDQRDTEEDREREQSKFEYILKIYVLQNRKMNWVKGDHSREMSENALAISSLRTETTCQSANNKRE